MLLGVSRAAVFTFHLLEGKKQGNFLLLLLFHFIFLEALCVLHQPETLM